MKYATICSGINAPACAWNSLGWDEQFCAEIEPFPCSVLAHHYPTVPNLGDITKYETWPDFGIDLLAGGTPCQSFSLAGLRKGMDDPRGQLTRAFIGIAAKYRPTWLLWENVPGVLSADGGAAFAGFLAGLTGRKITMPAEGWGNFGIVAGIPEAYGLAWRVLDTQFVRVDSHPRACPQRRERVFVVGHLGGQWQRAAAVLLERESLRGDPAPRRETGKGTTHSVAPCIAASGRGFERSGDTRGQDAVVAVSHALTGEGHDASEDGTGRGTPLVACPLTTKPHADNESQHDKLLVMPVAPTMRAGGNATGGDRPPGTDVDTADSLIAFSTKDYGQDAQQNLSPTLRSGNHDGSHANGGVMPAIAFAFAENQRAEVTMKDVADGLKTGGGKPGQGYPAVMTLAIRGRRDGRALEIGGEVAYALTAPTGGSRAQERNIATGIMVRRLTPTECARLQGFPDAHLNVLHRGKPAADGPKYKALGNSMSCNTMRWLGQRIQMVDDLTKVSQ